ncbi:hypothetical protein BFJ72_g4666 [Fusarium proliferatum]|uniref:Cytochrome P450 n=1 Tax=Gibberella intermedia TaxID=948311 RepID=A0A420TP25_GIBIN|nr:hypothetical protein BFJ72_g4666 [Fusarium proliferatum]
MLANLTIRASQFDAQNIFDIASSITFDRVRRFCSFFALIAVIALLTEWARVLNMRRKLPPGPFPFPIIGNHFQTPAVRPWIAWEKWGKYYNSPLMTIWIGGYPRIIMSDAWVASDLLEKKSDVFSSRPKLIMMGDLINTTTTNQTMLEYGNRWRLHRKLMHTAVGTQAVRGYRSYQADESKILTRDFLEIPHDYEMSIERYSVSTSSIVGWGRRIDKNNDYVAVQALKFMESVNLVVPGAFIMEALPWLQKLPSWLYKFPHALRLGSAIGARYFYMLTEESMGNKQKAFNSTVMKAQKDHSMTDLEVAGLMANVIGGGVDTTSSTMVSCILAMCAFPEVQKKAQEELDHVVGHDRSPDWSDIDSNKLPYITAIVKETLRWRTVTVLAGIPHANTVDIDYRGYHFPAGTNFTGNMWAIHRNPVDFPDPDNFIPERFLDGPWKKPYPNARGSNPFGWGRRQCSGQPLAEQGLFYSLGRIIWAFHIEPGLNKDGSVHNPDIFAFTESENMRPMPFPARFTPRSEKIKNIISEEAAIAREALRCYDGDTKLTMADAVSRPAFE